MALNPAITAANGQTDPLRQAQLVLSGSVMSTVAVGLTGHQHSRATRGGTTSCLYALLSHACASSRQSACRHLCLSSIRCELGSSYLRAGRHAPCALDVGLGEWPSQAANVTRFPGSRMLPWAYQPRSLLIPSPHTFSQILNIGHVLGRRRAHTA